MKLSFAYVLLLASIAAPIALGGFLRGGIGGEDMQGRNLLPGEGKNVAPGSRARRAPKHLKPSHLLG